jgi:ADP-ribose pyrophosphatase YjhB (NUDIX family)
VDTIVHREGKVLLGWRTIAPYRNVWALIGGRMYYGESFRDTSVRNCRESGLRIRGPQYLGVFPVKFPNGRHDLSICIAARHASGDPKPTRELAKYVWVAEDQLREVDPIGGNYLKMLRTWFGSRKK